MKTHESRVRGDGRVLGGGLLARMARALTGRRGADAPHGDAVYLDPVIHERTRLAILTALFTAPAAGLSFSDLRDALGLTDGNLLTHLRTLEESQHVERIKEGAGRGSSTTLRLAPHGRKAFAQYLDQLETLVQAARQR